MALSRSRAMFDDALRLIAQDIAGSPGLPFPIVALRLIGAGLLCGLIGYEREAGDHAAGLRTHMLVGIGAATFALVTLQMVEMFAHRPDTIRMDPIRLIEAATAGVAFLAAGMIVLSRGEVKNLTTGAGMWLAAAIGLACGLGYWPIAAPEVRVVNAGVSGDTSAGGLARIDWTLTEDVEGLILALGANDLLRGVDPAVTRANLDGILAKAEARDLPVLFAGIPAPGNYGPEYQAQFDAIFPELAEKHGATLFPNFLAGLGDRPDLVTVGPLMQPDGLHPNAQGVAAVVAAIGPAVLDLVSAAQQD